MSANPTGSSRPVASRPRSVQTLRRLGWGVADQGVSSLSNFGLGLFAARSLSASDFGAFSLAFVTYSVVINAARGLATDPFMVRHSGDPVERWRSPAKDATGTALGVGIVAGIISIVVGLMLPAPVGPVYIALGVGLPGLVLQDSWRFAFFAAGRGSASFLNDLIWGGVLIVTLVVFHEDHGSSAPAFILAFGGTATLGAVLGCLQARARPRPLRAVAWLRTHRSLSLRYFVENVSISGASQIRSFVLGAFVSLASVGYVRASEILMGPIFVLLSGLSQVAVPEARRVFQHDAHRLRRFCLIFAASQAAVAVGWGVVLMTIFPLGPGQLLIKDLWAPTQPLLPAITLTVLAVSFVNAGLAGLRAMGISRRSLRAQLGGSAAYVIATSIGALTGGALGASWGVTIAQTISAVLWWYQLKSALADHHAAVPQGVPA